LFLDSLTRKSKTLILLEFSRYRAEMHLDNSKRKPKTGYDKVAHLDNFPVFGQRQKKDKFNIRTVFRFVENF